MNWRFEVEERRPIPIPLGQRWRDFRVAYLPVLAFTGLVMMIGWMWTRYVAPATLVGQVEIVRANVLSVVAGTVREINVQRFEAVTNSQALAVVTSLEPDQVQAELAAAEADLRVMKTRMDIDRARNLDNYSRLRADCQLESLNLELARVRLRQAEAEFARQEKLFRSQLVALGSGDARNDFGFDVANRDRDACRAEIAGREKAVADLKRSVEQLEASGAVKVEPADVVLEHAIAAQRERIERLQKPIVLRSPINGFVSVINLLPGEKVVAGAPILVVNAVPSGRILAWVRQPLTVRPQVGDIVRVQRASPRDGAFRATVVQVGQQLDRIAPTAIWGNVDPNRWELGLPLVVQVATTQELVPGETIQLSVVKSARPAPHN